MIGRGLARRIAARAARPYIAGETLAEALAAADRLQLPTTLGYWDGADDGPALVADRYVELLGALGARHGAYASIKLPALGTDPAAAEAVAAAARTAGVLLHFDSLEESAADRTLRLVTELAPSLSVGATVPGAWSRSVQDAAGLAEAGVRVRVVKGQWPGDRDPRAGFLAVVRRLAEHGGRIAIATHDASLAKEALALCDGLSPELELLYGLPLQPASAVARDRGVQVRIYVPYGAAYLPYALRRAREQPRILWWIARDAVRPGT